MEKKSTAKQPFSLRTFFMPIGIYIIGVMGTMPVMAQEEVALKESEAAEEAKVTLDVGADLVSRYIWRGIDFGNSAAIQPTLSLSAFGITFGAWASYGLTRTNYPVNDTVSINYNYSECDLFLAYTYKYFTLMLYDYYTPSPIDSLPGNNYFDWNNSTTLHTLEVSLIFDGPEKFPLQFIASTLVYGADKNKDSTGVYGVGDKNNFSTYFELSYLIDIKGFELRPFIGGIPFGSSWYGTKAGLTNVGIHVGKEIPISKKFSIPICSNLVVNPMSKKIYLVFILTI
ncbi:MAG: hypothetical protein V1733_04555 [bacterium]